MGAVAELFASGARVAVGSLASLGLAFGGAIDAPSNASRTGLYADVSTPGSELMGVVVGGVEAVRHTASVSTFAGSVVAESLLANGTIVAGLGITGLSEAQIVATYADDSSGQVVFDFGGGTTLTIASLSDDTGLETSLDLI